MAAVYSCAASGSADASQFGESFAGTVVGTGAVSGSADASQLVGSSVGTLPEIAITTIAAFLEAPLNAEPFAPLMRTCAIRWRRRKRHILRQMLDDMSAWLDSRPSPFVEIAATRLGLVEVPDVL